MTNLRKVPFKIYLSSEGNVVFVAFLIYVKLLNDLQFLSLGFTFYPECFDL